MPLGAGIGAGIAAGMFGSGMVSRPIDDGKPKYSHMTGNWQCPCPACGSEVPIQSMENPLTGKTILQKKAGCHRCGQVFPTDDPQSASPWKEPTDSERSYAMATMPGKANGHIIGWRRWNLTERKPDIPVRDKEIDSLLGMDSAELWKLMMDSYNTILAEKDGTRYRLRSTSSRHVWAPNEPVIAVNDERLGNIGKGGGVYAYKEQEDLELYGSIYGRIALWGDVIEHRSGYRARYAYPVELFVPDRDLVAYGSPTDVADQLRKAYNVPVSIYKFDEVEAMAHQMKSNLSVKQQYQNQINRIMTERMRAARMRKRLATSTQGLDLNQIRASFGLPPLQPPIHPNKRNRP